METMLSMSISPVRPSDILSVMSLILFGPMSFVTTPSISHTMAIIITIQYGLQYFTIFPRELNNFPPIFS